MNFFPLLACTSLSELPSQVSAEATAPKNGAPTPGDRFHQQIRPMVSPSFPLIPLRFSPFSLSSTARILCPAKGFVYIFFICSVLMFLPKTGSILILSVTAPNRPCAVGWWLAIWKSAAMRWQGLRLSMLLCLKCLPDEPGAIEDDAT